MSHRYYNHNDYYNDDYYHNGDEIVVIPNNSTERIIEQVNYNYVYGSNNSSNQVESYTEITEEENLLSAQAGSAGRFHINTFIAWALLAVIVLIAVLIYRRSRSPKDPNEVSFW